MGSSSADKVKVEGGMTLCPKLLWHIPFVTFGEVCGIGKSIVNGVRSHEWYILCRILTNKVIHCEHFLKVTKSFQHIHLLNCLFIEETNFSYCRSTLYFFHLFLLRTLFSIANDRVFAIRHRNVSGEKSGRL